MIDSPTTPTDERVKEIHARHDADEDMLTNRVIECRHIETLDRWANAHIDRAYLLSALAREREAVEKEREACAKIADDVAAENDLLEREYLSASQYITAEGRRKTAYMARELATAIRSRARRPLPEPPAIHSTGERT